ncbi:putative SNF2 family helicase/ATPase [Aspergillus alliaceus]|uniref:putative SNF2 family helicase/ATPase n=1 Tax=Petromyces alliaceus TaxID=209559 RepID=UPI0012A5E9E8|nr:SNF2 family N-terminal domain-containing protein [Aspergillus alliaceus]KAB8230672.1 SNF2 family N-terminal domain-containing protein [Aspergillus alliaceus]
MSVAEAKIFFPGAVPDNLVTALARRSSKGLDSDATPNKRRKLTYGIQSLRELNGLSDSGVPLGYIPLARFHLYMDFARENPVQDGLDTFIESSSQLPVLILIAKHPRASPTSNDWLKLELVTTTNRETIFEFESDDPQLLILGKDLELAQNLVCADCFPRKIPVACYQSTLYIIPDRKRSFYLETIILWKDSLDILGNYQLLGETRRAFSRYVLHEQHGLTSGHSHSQPGWSPRDFYDNVYVPPDTPGSSAEVTCSLIECRLFPFQRRAVRWLLQREGVELQADGQVVPVKDRSNGGLPTSFRQFTDADGRVCFASQLFMIVSTDLSKWYDAGNHLRGGILAEEMGLGKTVEMISLMCLNRRLLTYEETFVDRQHGSLRPSGATLIITPPAILEQWEQEIRLHAPGLSVFHYTGIQRHRLLSDDELVELLADQDVVLTTYDVLSREVYYSGDAPQRNLRHKKRFEPRRTPLVRISWWRACIDEAQMIESGVSNAARVARLIPRQNAWAVTGTPLRKDITDLLGLLLFLHYEPFCGVTWNRLCGSFRPELANIVRKIALRHSKDHVRSELHIPPQKRVVITIPFTAVEEQRYGQLYEEMCEACGLDPSGAPLDGDWDPDDPLIIERMRSWLIKLRRTCLHPAGKPRRGLGTGTGPLRSVSEVLEVMVDQTDALIHAEERSLLMSQLRRGQLLENAKHRQQALELWTKSLKRASAIVKECRDRLHLERIKRRMSAIDADQDAASVDTTSEDEGEEAAKNTRVVARQRLRAALEIQHICVFFTGNAYYQIKTDPKLTAPDSEEYKFLEEREIQAYETAKLIRKEMLTDISRKAGHLMKVIRERSQKNQFSHIPKMKPQIYSKGIESHRVLDKLEAFCDAMNKHAVQYDEWRQIMIKLLSQSLIDQEDEAELEGDEYEKSTKHQDEMYVYMEALRAMFADRHDALTGQKNVLIAHEIKSGIVQAQRGEGPSPNLFLQMVNTRSSVKPDCQLGSLRGIISELRSLATSLEWQANGGSPRARAELEIVSLVLQNASQMASEQGKVAANMEREVEMFRDTMNNRLEYYRQLQQISDTVAPYDEESAGKSLDEMLFSSKLEQEEAIDEKISALRAKRRYLIHLRDESGSDDSSKICVICQSSFEVGVLTVCGHKYCKDCLRMWWHQHRTCPTCKKRLKANDFYQITYKPQEFVVQEEKPQTRIEPERPPKNSLYTDIGSGTLREIKNIDLDGSFSTKIDTLARHVLWLRHHDPGAKSVIFSQYKDFLEVLAIAFYRFKIGFSSVDGKDGISKFKRDPSVECFLLHAKAHSSGLNLVNATHVFLCEPLINTAIELQAIARVHRIGQHRPTTVWMYLVSGTVEESIYDLSVSRRLAHIIQKEKAEQPFKDGKNAVMNLTESAIDSANSLEIQDAALSRLMVGGASGGELVKKDDLWQCLFGNSGKEANGFRAGAGGEVARFLREDAAEQRRAA